MKQKQWTSFHGNADELVPCSLIQCHLGNQTAQLVPGPLSHCYRWQSHYNSQTFLEATQDVTDTYSAAV